MFRRFLPTIPKPTTSLKFLQSSPSRSSTAVAVAVVSFRSFHTVRGASADGPTWAVNDESHVRAEGNHESRVADNDGFSLLRRPGMAGGMHDTATGLAKEGIGQMSSEDVMMRIESALQWYSPITYAWLALPSIDLVDALVLADVVPKDHAHQHLCRWFAAPEDVVHFPDTLRDTLGRERLRVVEPHMMKVFRDYETISPLNRVFAKYPELPRDIWTAVTRWMAAMTASPEMKETILTLTLALSNGLGPQSLCLPDLQQQRGTMVGHLLIAVGAEYGAVSLAQLGVDLLLINGTQCTFQDQKTLTVAFSRTSARVMDWSVRGSGELLRCLPRWFRHHIAGNKEDGLVQLLAEQKKKKKELDGNGARAKGNEDEDENDDDELRDDDDIEAVEITGTSDMYTSEEAARLSEELAVKLEDGSDENEDLSMVDDVDSNKKLKISSSGRKSTTKSQELRGLGDDDNSIDLGETESMLIDDQVGGLKKQKSKNHSVGFDGEDGDDEKDFAQEQIQDHKNDRESMMHSEGDDDEPATAALIGNAPASTYFSTKKSQKVYYDNLHQNLLKQAKARQDEVSEKQKERWAKVHLHREKWANQKKSDATTTVTKYMIVKPKSPKQKKKN